MGWPRAKGDWYLRGPSETARQCLGCSCSVIGEEYYCSRTTPKGYYEFMCEPCYHHLYGPTCMTQLDLFPMDTEGQEA